MSTTKECIEDIERLFGVEVEKLPYKGSYMLYCTRRADFLNLQKPKKESIMKKIIEIIINILTLGFSAYLKYQKNEKKLRGVYKSVNALLHSEASDTEKAKGVLEMVQRSEGIFDAVSEDLVELYKEGIIPKIISH